MRKIRNLFRRINCLFLTDEKCLRYLGVNIGKHCLISTRKVSSEPYLITIGNYVRIASNTAFFTHGGLWAVKRKYNDTSSKEYFGKIEIGDYTYIGEGCMIMPGIKIGSNVIIGAGSVVTKSIPDNCMAAGNPIRYIGNTDEFYNRLKKIDTAETHQDFKKKKKFLLSLDEDAFISKPYLQTK